MLKRMPRYRSSSHRSLTILLCLLATIFWLSGCSSPDEATKNNDTQPDVSLTDTDPGQDTGPDDTGPPDPDTSDETDTTPEDASDDTNPPGTDPVSLKLIALNDFHGRIEAPAGKVNHGGHSVDAGGIAYMKAYVDQFRENAEHSIVVAAGDLVGATPLISSMFHDEPAIEALNELGLEISAVGNHEFDSGWQELMRLQNGGCHTTGCHHDEPYQGATFQYLAANVVTSEGDTVLPALQIKDYDGIRVGFIGIVLDETSEMVLPSGIEGLDFRDEIEVINERAAELQADGVEAIVVLIHEGGQPTSSQQTLNDCGDLRGPVVDIVEKSSSAVDVFITGHTHQTYICTIDDKLVTSAYSFGRVLTEIDLTLDPQTGDVTEKSAQNHIIYNDVLEPDPALSELVDHYVTLSQGANPVVGQITKTISYFNAGNAGESPMGNLVADSHLYATRDPGEGGAQIAFANAGGIRASISSPGATAENPGDVTYSQLHAVLPFGNTLITISLTGQQIHELLEQQFTESTYSIMQVSNGFSYAYTLNAPVGQHIDPQSIKLNGVTLDPQATYRVTVNNYMAEGGDYLSVLKQGTDRLQGPSELDMFVQYFQAHSPITAPTPNRITRLDP